MTQGCPHDNVVDCPLYLAAHGVGVPVPQAMRPISCDDGRLFEDPASCAMARGLDYAAALARLRVVAPRLVAQCEWDASVRSRSGQRLRNMVAAAVH